MENVHESLSEDSIIVDGLQDFAATPQDFNKKAYVFKMEKVQLINILPVLDLAFLCFSRVNTQIHFSGGILSTSYI